MEAFAFSLRFSAPKEVAGQTTLEEVLRPVVESMSIEVGARGLARTVPITVTGVVVFRGGELNLRDLLQNSPATKKWERILCRIGDEQIRLRGD